MIDGDFPVRYVGLPEGILKYPSCTWNLLSNKGFTHFDDRNIPGSLEAPTGDVGLWPHELEWYA